MINYESVYKSAGLMMKLEYVGGKNNDGTPLSVEFFAYLKSYNDGFSPTWNKETAFGRTDPLCNYASTSRKIIVSFDIPAFDLEESRLNLFKLSKLAKFVYPVIDSKNTQELFSRKISAQFKQGPILRFSFGNIIRDYQSNGGLYGFIDSEVNIDWKLEHGVFISSGSSPLEPDLGKVTRMYPKIVELSLQYQVLHNNAIGHDEANSQQYLFPYGMLTEPEGNNGEVDGSSQPQTNQVYGYDTDTFSYEAEQFTREPKVGNKMPGDFRNKDGKNRTPFDMRETILKEPKIKF